MRSGTDDGKLHGAKRAGARCEPVLCGHCDAMLHRRNRQRPTAEPTHALLGEACSKAAVADRAAESPPGIVR